MPELPDIVVYIKALEKRIQGSILERVRIASPFLLRTAVPPLSSVEGKKIVELRRLGKRICLGLEGDLWLVLHLMIAGRLHWYNERSLTSSHEKFGLTIPAVGGYWTVPNVQDSDEYRVHLAVTNLDEHAYTSTITLKDADATRATLDVKVLKPGCVVGIERQTNRSLSGVARAAVSKAEVSVSDGRILTLEERRVTRAPGGSQEETVTIRRISAAPAC